MIGKEISVQSIFSGQNIRSLSVFSTYDFEAKQTASTNRRDLNYTVDVNCVQDELLGNYLRDLSHPDLFHPLAVYKCIEEDHNFPEDIPSVRRTNMSKDTLIRSLHKKKYESILSCLDVALEKIEKDRVNLSP